MRGIRWLWVVAIFLLSGCAVAFSDGVGRAERTPPVPAESLEAVLPEAGPTGVPGAAVEFLPEESPPRGAEREFSTDFSRHTVPYSEVLSGGPPKDGIPAIDAPQFTTVEAADAWLEDQEPVILMEIGGVARAYPIQILMWHEIVNDTLGGVPVTVTFCPLCNTAIAFDRRVDDLVLDFGTTGRLRYSNLIMYDRQTETWWQQATGEGIAGQFAGRELTFLPANMIAWSDFRETYPDSEVLSRSTGFSRSYGSNPYTGYDNINSSPFLFEGPQTPGQLRPMARVLAVELGGETVAYPYETLQAYRVVNDTVGGTPVVVIWQAGVASALDRPSVAAGRDVGTLVAFSRELDGELLTFQLEEGRVVDDATGSAWNVLGETSGGPHSGRSLTPVVGVNHFWFSWAAFKPETRVFVLEADPTPGVDTEDPASDPVEDSEAATHLVDALEHDFEITIYTGADILGGDRVMFSDLLAQGRPVMVEFWAGLCPTCRRALPETQAAYLRYGDEVLFVGLDIGSYTGLGNEQDARSLYADLGLSFPSGTFADADVLRAYRVTSLPTTVFFKPNGEVFERGGGITRLDVLSEKLEALIAASGR
jgi:thiol-disulfide isomerase/thioredoxin